MPGEIQPPDQIVSSREAAYGDPAESFARVAQVWSGIIGHEIQAWQVPLLLAGLKLVRTDYCPDYSDNSDDVQGYIDVFRRIIGPDMVHARSVPDYEAQKFGGS